MKLMGVMRLMRWTRKVSLIKLEMALGIRGWCQRPVPGSHVELSDGVLDIG